MSHAVMKDPDNPVRRHLLEQTADAESTQILLRAFRDFRACRRTSWSTAFWGLAATRIVISVCCSSPGILTRLPKTFAAGSNPRRSRTSLPEAEKLLRSYDPARLNLLDYGYLLGQHPLKVWCAGELRNNPNRRRRRQTR